MDAFKPFLYLHHLCDHGSCSGVVEREEEDGQQEEETHSDYTKHEVVPDTYTDKHGVYNKRSGAI